MVKLPHTDERPLTFGKYKGESPNEIAKHDPEYLTWIYENVEERPVSTELYEACQLDIAENNEFPFDEVNEW